MNLNNLPKSIKNHMKHYEKRSSNEKNDEKFKVKKDPSKQRNNAKSLLEKQKVQKSPTIHEKVSNMIGLLHVYHMMYPVALYVRTGLSLGCDPCPP